AHGDVGDAELGQHVRRCLDLSRPTVNDQQVRRVGELARPPGLGVDAGAVVRRCGADGGAVGAVVRAAGAVGGGGQVGSVTGSLDRGGPDVTLPCIAIGDRACTVGVRIDTARLGEVAAEPPAHDL